MVDKDTLIPIIAGSLGGLIFLLIILALTIYFCWGNKRKKLDEKKKFNRLYSKQESNPSQPSTVSKEKDPKLPKVSSSGLWVSSSLYAGSPADAYYIGNIENGGAPRHQPHPKPPGKKVPPPVPQKRAAPDPRMMQDYAHQHMVYQNNLRIYHSQQLAPVAENGLYSAYDYKKGNYPVMHYGYEQDVPWKPANGQLPGVHDPRAQGQRAIAQEVQLRRSQSDVIHKGEHKARKNSGPKAKRHSKREEERRERSGSHASSKKSSQRSGKEQRHSANIPIVETPEVSTDNRNILPDVHVFSTVNSESDVYRQPVRSLSSSKKSNPEVILRAKDYSKSADELNKTNNITDDEKRFITKSSDDITAEKEINLRPYVYKGDLEQSPDRSRKSDYAYENPLIETMEQMIEERSLKDRDPETGRIERLIQEPAPKMPPAVTSYETTFNSRQQNVDIPDSARPDSPVSVTMSNASVDLSNQGKHVTADAFRFLDEYDDAVENTDVTDTNEDRSKSPVSSQFMY